MQWLKPISAEPRNHSGRQHLLPYGKGMMMSACGRFFNLDFATKSDKTPKCKKCEKSTCA